MAKISDYVSLFSKPLFLFLYMEQKQRDFSLILLYFINYLKFSYDILRSYSLLLFQLLSDPLVFLSTQLCLHLKNNLLSLILFSLFSLFCSMYTLGCVVIHLNVVNLQGARSLKKMHSTSPSSSQWPIAPQLVVGFIPTSLLHAEIWTGLSLHGSCVCVSQPLWVHICNFPAMSRKKMVSLQSLTAFGSHCLSTLSSIMITELWREVQHECFI